MSRRSSCFPDLIIEASRFLRRRALLPTFVYTVGGTTNTKSRPLAEHRSPPDWIPRRVTCVLAFRTSTCMTRARANMPTQQDGVKKKSQSSCSWCSGYRKVSLQYEAAVCGLTAPFQQTHRQFRTQPLARARDDKLQCRRTPYRTVHTLRRPFLCLFWVKKKSTII